MNSCITRELAIEAAKVTNISAIHPMYFSNKYKRSRKTLAQIAKNTAYLALISVPSNSSSVISSMTASVGVWNAINTIMVAIANSANILTSSPYKASRSHITLY